MWIFTWLIGTAIGRGIIALAVGGIAWVGFALHYEHKGAAKQVAKYVAAGKVNSGKAKRARKDLAKVPDKDLYDQFMRWE